MNKTYELVLEDIEEAVLKECERMEKDSSIKNDYERYAFILEKVDELSEDTEFLKDSLKKYWDATKINKVEHLDRKRIWLNAIDLALNAIQIAAIANR